MKPWMALSVVVTLCGCASDPAPRVRCKGPWQELPRISGVSSESAVAPEKAAHFNAPDSREVGQTRGAIELRVAPGAALVGVADKIPRGARQFFGEEIRGGTLEGSEDLAEVCRGR